MRRIWIRSGHQCTYQGCKLYILILLFFREMSDITKPISMEVEEGGIEAYMSYFQGMLDGLDNPSEVSGVGVGTLSLIHISEPTRPY